MKQKTKTKTKKKKIFQESTTTRKQVREHGKSFKRESRQISQAGSSRRRRRRRSSQSQLGDERPATPAGPEESHSQKMQSQDWWQHTQKQQNYIRLRKSVLCTC